MSIDNSEYDFIVVGGGTSGLVVASRLSEDPQTQVLVIEAGPDQTSNPAVNVPGLWASLLATDMNWAFTSEKQPALKNRTVGFAQGRLLGGSSGVNPQAFNAPSKAGIDAWQELGNKDWNWDSLSPYLRKCHTLSMPSKDVTNSLGLDYLEGTDHCGKSGPLQISYSAEAGEPLAKAWVDTFKELDQGISGDPFSGTFTGGFANGTCVDASTKQRSYAASAYYLPVKDRPNLHLKTDLQVNKINLNTQSHGTEAVAAGVTAVTKDKTKVTFRARKEVILAAGTFNSPKLLELSGIGSADVLRQHGVDVLVDNRNVGENLQDHPMVGIGFQVRDDIHTLDNINRQEPEAVNAAMTDYEKNRTGPFSQGGVNSMAYVPVVGDSVKADIVRLLDEHLPQVTSEHESPEIELYRKVLTDKELSAAAFFPYSGQGNYGAESGDLKDTVKPDMTAKYTTVAGWLSYPLSRGSTHITSGSIADKPRIDAGFYKNPLDLEIFARIFQYLEVIMSTKAMRSVLKPDGLISPTFAPIGEGANGLEAVKDYIRKCSISGSHPCGTCAMKPKDKGGVVSSNLIVYGTSNVRVIDASMIPIISRGNLMTVVYAVAERAADLIKKHHALS